MPSDERYGNHVITRVPFRDSDWLPEVCHLCDYHFGDETLYFYDVCDRNYQILDDQTGFCSSDCCRDYIDTLNEGINANYERPHFPNLDLHYVEMQEEATED